MYNRYVPQSDGSFQKSRLQDAPARQPQGQNAPPPPPPAPPPCSDTPVQKPSTSSLGFLKQLLPKGLDFGDVAILFLLLLMAGENEENRNNAFLTMALYCIL